MRSIDVSTDVFSLIWAARMPGEESEDQILLRVLSGGAVHDANGKPAKWSSPPIQDTKEADMHGKIRWVDDVVMALKSLGGQARLHRIYYQVEKQRRSAGRSVPRSLDATIRRTLEDFSSDSANFRGEDLFEMPEGPGAGLWALRKRA
jgi:hypothetical protein